MKHPYFEGVLSFPHGETALHASVRAPASPQHALLLPARLPSAAAVVRVCACCATSTSSTVPLPVFFPFSVWTISQAVLLLPSCRFFPTPIMASFRSILSSFYFQFVFALTPIISSGLICCSFPPASLLLASASLFPPNQWAYWLRISVRYPSRW